MPGHEPLHSGENRIDRGTSNRDLQAGLDSGPSRLTRGLAGANVVLGSQLEPPADSAVAGAAAALSLVPHPAAQAAAMALQVVGHFDAKRKAREAERKSTAVRLKDVRVIGNPDVVMVVGLSAFEGNRSYPGISNNISGGNAARDRGAAYRRVWGEFIFEDDPGGLTHRGRENEFLLQQYVLSLGDIPGLANVRINSFPVEIDTPDGPYTYSRRLPLTDTCYGYSKVIVRSPDTASPMRRAFGDPLWATAKYKGMTYADVATQMPYDGGGLSARARMWRNRGDFPQPLFWPWGIVSRELTATGFSSTRSWSENIVRVIAEYITNPDLGPALGDSVIDVPSFKAAQDAGDEVYLGTGGTLRTRAVPVFIGGTSSPGTYGSVLASKGWPAGVDVNGFGSMSATDVDARGLVLRRGAYWGVVETPLRFYDALDQMTQSFPGLIVWEVGGKYKASVPDPWATRESQVNLTINPEDRPEGLYASVSEKDANSRATHVLVTYNSLNHGFKPVTAIWPEAGSPERRALVRMNGNREHEVEIRVAGVCSRFHATAVGQTACAMSNRREIVDFLQFGEGDKVPEPGDVVHSVDKIAGVDAIHRLDAVEIDDRLGTTRVVGTEFFPQDFAPPPVEYDVIRADGRPAHTGRAGLSLILERNNVRMAPGDTFRFRARVTEPSIDQVAVDDIVWRWERIGNLGDFSNQQDDELRSAVDLTFPLTAPDGLYQFRVIVRVEVGNRGLRGAQTYRFSALFQAEVREGAPVGGSDPLTLELRPIGSGAWQAVTGGGNGTAITYAWSLIPSSAASLRDLRTRSESDIGEFCEVYDSGNVAGAYIRVVAKQGTAELSDTMDLGLSHSPAYCGG